MDEKIYSADDISFDTSEPMRIDIDPKILEKIDRLDSHVNRMVNVFNLMCREHREMLEEFGEFKKYIEERIKALEKRA